MIIYFMTKYFNWLSIIKRMEKFTAELESIYIYHTTETDLKGQKLMEEALQVAKNTIGNWF